MLSLQTARQVRPSLIIVVRLGVRHHPRAVSSRVDLTDDLLQEAELLVTAHDPVNYAPDETDEATDQTKEGVEACHCPLVLVIQAVLDHPDRPDWLRAVFVAIESLDGGNLARIVMRAVMTLVQV